jgi:membrane protease YdiL (CAAX protease family)
LSDLGASEPAAGRLVVRGDGLVSGRKLAAWSGLVGTLIVLAYVGNAAGPAPANDILYRYSTAVAVLVQYAIISVIVFFISRGLARETLGFRRPASWRRAGALTLASLLAIWAASWVLGLFLDAGEEQGLVPDSWDSSRAGPFIANFIVIAGVAPIVEETTYRGLGFAAVRSSYGALAAILVTGIAFGLSHGLVLALPVLSLFGIILAALRWKTDSLYPPILLHALFNGAALIVAVTIS